MNKDKIVIYIQLLIPLLITSCASLEPPTAPSWMGDNCTKDNKNYYFTSMGKGKDLNTAALWATKNAKISAGACIFGGSFKSHTFNERTLEKESFETSSEFIIEEFHINWESFEKVSLKEETVTKKGVTFVFHTYKWPIKAINREKTRAKKLKKAIEAERVLKNEVEWLKQLNNEKEKKLKQLQIEEERMAVFTSRIDRALANISKLKKQKMKESKSIRSLFSSLPCGITIGEIIKLYKKPDKYRYQDRYSDYTSILEVYWGEMVVRMRVEEIQKTSNTDIDSDSGENNIFKAALNAKPDFVYHSYGLNNWGYKICDLK